MIETAPFETVRACRACGGDALHDLHAFGNTPIADKLRPPGATEPDLVAPLTLCHCSTCALCQIRETVAPGFLFGPAYPYHSSVSPSLVAHFHRNARHLIGNGALQPGGLVVEAGSNDGTMLAPFRDAGFAVLGIDPAAGPVRQARQRGIETLRAFFSLDTARKIAARGRRAELFLANNVLAHVDDPNGFVAGIGALLSPTGHAVIEVPYLLDLVDKCAFDTIYHQHLMYFSLTALAPLLARHGLALNDAEPLWIHGGSLRLTLSRRSGQSARLAGMLRNETARGVTDPAFFAPFLTRMAALRRDTLDRLDRLAGAGNRIAAYGAAAKGTTLLHYLGIGTGHLEFVADKSPWKHGAFMPGTDLEILPPERLLTEDIDAVLLLAWNFADEIIGENRAFLEAGRRFLIPVPALREVTAP